jgi:hypothetical protein
MIRMNLGFRTELDIVAVPFLCIAFARIIQPFYEKELLTILL